jgi:hypothetical protein
MIMPRVSLSHRLLAEGQNCATDCLYVFGILQLDCGDYKGAMRVRLATRSQCSAGSSWNTEIWRARVLGNGCQPGDFGGLGEKCRNQANFVEVKS